MGWGDRIIGLIFGAILGLCFAVPAMLIAPFILPLSKGAILVIGQGIMIVAGLWGWERGSFTLGRWIGWAKRKLGR